MGLFKDVFSPSKAEKEREEALLKKKREIYPVITYDNKAWAKLSSTEKIKECQKLGAIVAELRLLKDGKIEDTLLSDGHRVDERAKNVYTTIFNEYARVYNLRYCDPILQTVTVNQDRLETQRQADILQARIEKDIEKQRTIIIAVGGVVLLLGTVLILRKL